MKNFFSLVLFLLSFSGFSQDQLFKKDNTKIEVKILEINPSEIKYKLFTYQDGPTITISKKDVALIIYQNGVHEVLSAPVETPVVVTEAPMVIYNSTPTSRINRDSLEKAEFKELVSKKNLIMLNILDPLNGSFNLTYLREFADNYLHIYIPASVGFAAPYFTQAVTTMFSGSNYNYNYNTNYIMISDYRYTTKNYDIGLGIHFQSSGKSAVTHFVGPYVGTSQFTGTYTLNETMYDPTYGYNTYQTRNGSFTLNRIHVMLDNGILFRVTKHFNIMMLASFGYNVDTFTAPDNITKAYNFNKNRFPINAFKSGLSFGYRF
ncbi:MAG: hypothetical protein K0R26_2805 [Bacteroidota bacterium]|jgi:hypothetical protein|nr:hypothetical protein [Bacteroidota bacterium]